MRRWEIYLEFLLEIIFLGSGLLIFVFTFPIALRIFWPFLAGWTIAYITIPVCDRFEANFGFSRKWSSFLTSLFSILVLLIVFAGLFFVMTNQFIHWAEVFSENYQSYIQDLIALMKQRVEHGFLLLLIDKFEIFVHSAESYINMFLQRFGTYTVYHAGTIIKFIWDGLLGFVVMLLSSYLFLYDRERLTRAYDKILPEFMKDKISIFFQNTLGILGEFCIVQFKLMIVIIVILAVGFIVLRIPYAILLAVVSAFLDILPILGTGTILVPYAIISLLLGLKKIGFGVLGLYIIATIYKQVMQPKLLGERLELNSIFILVLMYAGIKINGLKGFICAMIYGIFFTNLYKRGAFDSVINRFKSRFRMLHELDQMHR